MSGSLDEERALTDWERILKRAPDFRFEHVNGTFGYVLTFKGRRRGYAVPAQWLAHDPRWFNLLLVYALDDLKKPVGT